ncbi:MAG: hypothetical protein AAFV72_24370, partial [Cyanobacteria bacterium J06635_1]
RAYGLAYLSVAYRALQNHDFETALTFKKQSLKYYPNLFRSKVFHRLGVILFLRRRLGNRRYGQLLQTLHVVTHFSIWPKPEPLNN